MVMRITRPDSAPVFPSSNVVCSAAVRPGAGPAGRLLGGFESYELGPGDSIAFDSSTPHEYLNKTGEPVHAIWVVVHSEPGRA